MKIAVLMTTYNRKAKTLTCLESLQNQILSTGIELSIYMTDDSSSDGTKELVAQRFPEVHIINGTGSLFWAGGMRLTWNTALKKQYAFYLLLNDDTILVDDAIERMLADPPSAKSSIRIGTTEDMNGVITYGGKKLLSSWKPGEVRAYSRSEYTTCDLGNANIMLVPHEVVSKIGILSSKFTHGIADYDYTLRAKKSGFGVFVVPGIVGTCQHDHGKNWKSGDTSLTERIKFLKSPKGLAYRAYLGFIKEHFFFFYPVAFSKLWLKTLFPAIWDRFKN